MSDEKELVHIQTSDGPICGFVYKNELGEYNKFHWIPYALPPVGNLRFLPPVPIKPWTETIDCTRPLPISITPSGEKIENDIEDCLYIHITTPKEKSEKLRPVMFWIGTYLYYYRIDEFLDNSLLVNEDIVFVKAFHRVGPFGFLSAKDVIAPGNAGLKDLVLSLKWVQRNIEAFGGDPNNVTLFGNCSGAALVHFLVLSPMAAGLFHKAVIQSGSVLNNWALVKNPTTPLLELAKELKINSNCAIEIVEILKTLPARDIVRATDAITEKRFKETNSTLEGFFTPCVEQDFEGQLAFLTKSPDLILKAGTFNRVPMIIGSLNVESRLLSLIDKNISKNVEKFNENTKLLMPNRFSGNVKNASDLSRKVVQFYMGENLTKLKEEQYLQLINDYYYLYYVNKSVRMHVQMAPEVPIYYYIFNFGGYWHVPNFEKCSDFFNSGGHGSDAAFLFQIRIHGDVPCAGGRDSVKTRSKVIRLWTNFAKYGNPTPDPDDELLQITWDPVENKDKLNYLSIAPDLTKGRNPALERIQFWENLQKEQTFFRIFKYFSEIGVCW